MSDVNSALTPRRAVLGSLVVGGAAITVAALQRTETESSRVTSTAHPKGWRHSDSIPNVELKTQTGRSVRLYDDLIRDQQVVMCFMYVRCQGFCPATTGLLRGVREALRTNLGPNVKLLSFTLDPEHDTPDVLGRYAKAFGAAEENSAPDKLAPWYFLTGSKDDIESVRKALGYTDPDPVRDADRSQHAAMITFGNDATNRWSTLPVGLNREQMMAGLMRTLGTDRSRYAYQPQPTGDGSEVTT